MWSMVFSSLVLIVSVEEISIYKKSKENQLNKDKSIYVKFGLA